MKIRNYKEKLCRARKIDTVYEEADEKIVYIRRGGFGEKVPIRLMALLCVLCCFLYY